MRPSFITVGLAVALMFVGAVQAHTTIIADVPEGPFERFQTYSVPTTAYINCAVIGAEYSDGQELTMTIANAADYPWIEASEVPVTIGITKCQPTTDPALPGLYNILPANVEFTIGAMAPAFIDPVTLQPGAIGEANDGGTFDVQVEYDPNFTMEAQQPSYDYVDGSGVLTVVFDLTTYANADTTFAFEVTSELPEGVTAHIQESYTAPAPYLSNATGSIHTIELHFSSGDADHSGHMDGNDTMDAMADEDMGHMEASETTWESIDISLSVVASAVEDPTAVSEPQVASFTVVNTKADTDGHEHGDHDHGDENNGGFLDRVGIPGPSMGLVLVAVAGAVLALRRR